MPASLLRKECLGVKKMWLSLQDAERPDMHSAAKRGNEKKLIVRHANGRNLAIFKADCQAGQREKSGNFQS
jgi:cell division inhibitor SulA